MILEGMHRCEHCGHRIMWAYQVPQKPVSRLLDVEDVPENRVRLYRIGKTVERNGYRIPLDATIYCPNCNKLNSIEINE